MEALSGASLPRFKPLPCAPVMLIEAGSKKERDNAETDCDDKKNGSQEIRVALDEFKAADVTYDMLSLRVFYEDGGEHRPGRNGLNVRVHFLPAIIKALQEAEAEARAAGLLGGEGEKRAA